jgi:hypothetical protein
MFETPDGEVKAKNATAAARWYFQGQVEKGLVALEEGAKLDFTITDLSNSKEHNYEGVLQKASKASSFMSPMGAVRRKLKMVVHKTKSTKVARKNKTNQLL